MRSEETDDVRCAFCNKSKSQVKKFVACKNASGTIMLICDSCVEICHNSLEKANIKKALNIKHIMTPQEMFDKLTKIVKGQDAAVKRLSVLIYNHIKKITSVPSIDNVTAEKTCALIIGGTGCGKTLSVDWISQITGIPCVKMDANCFTEAGYVGEDVEVCISRLLQAADGDVQRASCGIVFIDEFDKLQSFKDGDQHTKDVSGAGVQNGLLMLLEGKLVEVPCGQYSQGMRRSNQETVKIHTKDILFILAGAFEGLEKIISKRIRPTNIGVFSKEEEKETYGNLMKQVEYEDLVKYGIISEMIGRLPVVIVFDKLTQKDLESILVNPESGVLPKYKRLLQMKDGADLRWTDEAVATIAEFAMKEKTQARGLRKKMEEILKDAMFEIPNYSEPVAVIIDEEVARGIIPPRIVPINPKKAVKRPG